jgi:hypothetical protein
MTNAQGAMSIEGCIANDRRAAVEAAHPANSWLDVRSTATIGYIGINKDRPKESLGTVPIIAPSPLETAKMGLSFSRSRGALFAIRRPCLGFGRFAPWPG